MKETTALQDLLEWVETSEKTDGHFIYDHNIKLKIKALMKNEKILLKIAYNDGALDELRQDTGRDRHHKDSEDYYSKKYEG